MFFALCKVCYEWTGKVLVGTSAGTAAAIQSVLPGAEVTAPLQVLQKYGPLNAGYSFELGTKFHPYVCLSCARLQSFVDTRSWTQLKNSGFNTILGKYEHIAALPRCNFSKLTRSLFLAIKWMNNER